MTRFGMDVTLAHPEGYGLIPEVVELARKQAAASRRHVRGGRRAWRRPFADADVVYPKSWAPYR